MEVEPRHVRPPGIGNLPVAQLTGGHVVSVPLPNWRDKRETARQAARSLDMPWAVAQRYRTGEPAGIVLDAALLRRDGNVQYLPALRYDEVAECLATVKARQGASVSSKLALKFLILTAGRSGEVRKATRDEIDVDGAVWTAPAKRMSTKREHRCTLSLRAVAVLEEAAELADGARLVLPGTRPGRPPSENMHEKLPRELGFGAVPNGFRSRSPRRLMARPLHSARAPPTVAVAVKWSIARQALLGCAPAPAAALTRCCPRTPRCP